MPGQALFHSLQLQLEPEVTAWMSHLSTPLPTHTYLNAVNNLVYKLKFDGNWQYLDRLWLFATEQQQHALVSLVNPKPTSPWPTNITAVNSPTWTKLKGWNSNGSSSYLNSNYNPTTTNNNLSLNNNAFGAYFLNTNSTAQFEMGGRSAAFVNLSCGVNYNSTYIFLQTNANDANSDGYGLNSTQVASATTGFFVATRTSSTNSSSSVPMWVRGVSYTPGSVFGSYASSSLPNVVMYILAYNNAGSAQSFSTKQQALAFYGSASINQQTFYNAIQTFATTIGFNV